MSIIKRQFEDAIFNMYPNGKPMYKLCNAKTYQVLVRGSYEYCEAEKNELPEPQNYVIWIDL